MPRFFRCFRFSKYETQYTYAGAIALAIPLALLWERQSFVAVPVALLTLMLVAHGLMMIQQRMYFLGFCQTRALETLKAVLPDAGPEAPRAVLIRNEDAPWWVIGVIFRAMLDIPSPSEASW